MNVDVGFSKVTHGYGIGVVIHDHLGQLVAAVSLPNVKASLVDQGEVQAILLGLQWTSNLGPSGFLV